MKVLVAVQRTITTTIEVDAATAADARRQIREYGLIEATSDMQVVDETVSARIAWAREA